ncbi:hypothetical protein H632_c2031p0, partial [Helicosporidium sp. ATCC 50920]
MKRGFCIAICLVVSIWRPEITGSVQPRRAVRAAGSTSSAPDLAAEYNARMNERMGWSKSREGLNVYEYHPEKGLYYHYITPSLILGSQPRTPEDIDALCSLGVRSIVCLQEDRDLAHWGVDAAALA